MVLLDKVHTHATGIKHINRIGFGSLQLGDLSRVVGLVNRGVDLVNDAALVHALEARQSVFASLVIGREQIDFFVAGVCGMLAHGLMQ